MKDDGEGIGETEKAHVFKRFTRLDSNQDPSGSGVGLALVNEIVKANGGWIDLKSEVGKGSVFTITIPQPDKIDTNESEQSSDGDLQAQMNSFDSKLPRLLIVEDDNEYRSYLYNILVDKFTCFTAKNGKDAIDVIESLDPDIVLTDYEMPHVHGIELARYVREQGLRKNIPVVMLTAYDEQDVCHQGWDALVDCVVSKTVAGPNLVSQLESLLGLRALSKACYTSDNPHAEHETIAEQLAPAYFSNEREQSFFTQLQSVLNKHYANDSFNRKHAADALAISERHLNRTMSSLFDYNFTEYLKRFRILKAKALLAEGKQITSVAFDVGFSSVSYFCSCFKSVMGETPKQYQSRALSQD